MKRDWKLYRPLVVVGPSGVGKGTLIGKLIAKYPSKFGFSVSYTTRAPRSGEEHGKDYFYVNHELFEQKIANDDFIEHCKVHSNFYGTEKHQIREMSEKSIIPILDIDIQGAKKMFKAFPDTNFIFICPPSIKQQRARLDLRATDSQEQRDIRIANSFGEIKECISSWQMIQYRIVNDDLTRATQTFLGVIESLYTQELGLE